MIKARTRKTPRQKMEAHLDNLYRELIRKRAVDRVRGCELCLTKMWSYLALEAAHCFGRGRRTVRWDPRNGAGLCDKCHGHIDEHEDAKEALFRRLLGDEAYENLVELAHKTTKDVPVDYKAKEIELKELLKEV